MFLSRISSFLRCSLLSSEKYFSVSSIQKCELGRTSNLYSEESDEPPKKPVPAYFRFLYGILPELKAKFPDSSHKEVLAIGNKLWKTLDISEKKQYIQSYHEDFDKYRLARLKYQCVIKDIPKNEEQSRIMTKSEKRKLKSLRKLSGRPKRPASPFVLFLMSKKDNLPKEQVANWVNDVVLEYNNLNKDEKTKYENESKKLREQYKKRISEWETTLIKKGQTDLLYKRSKFKEKD